MCKYITIEFFLPSILPLFSFHDNFSPNHCNFSPIFLSYQVGARSSSLLRHTNTLSGCMNVSTTPSHSARKHPTRPDPSLLGPTPNPATAQPTNFLQPHSFLQANPHHFSPNPQRRGGGVDATWRRHCCLVPRRRGGVEAALRRHGGGVEAAWGGLEAAWRRRGGGAVAECSGVGAAWRLHGGGVGAV